MGTINYRTSDFVTMGHILYDIEDFDADKEEILDIIKENKGEDATEDEYRDFVYSLMQDYYTEDCDCVKGILDNHNFEFFDIEIVNGYYDGFSIDISLNACDVESPEEKDAVRAEIEEIKEFLIDTMDYGCVSCHPFWYTKYDSREDTLKAIDKATASMLTEIGQKV